MNDFQDSMVQSWIDRNYLVRISSEAVKTVVGKSKAVGAALAVVVATAAFHPPVEAATVSTEVVFSSPQSSVDKRDAVSEVAAFGRIDDLLAKLAARVFEFPGAEAEAHAQAAAAASLTNENQSAEEWADMLLSQGNQKRAV